MNDRAVALLENYDIEVLRSRKGRDSILCETPEGTCIFMEYKGPREKIVVWDALLKVIAEKGYVPAETLIPTKEEEFLVKDQDGVSYILKTFFNGKECNVRDLEECKEAVCTLARLHYVMKLPNHEALGNMPVFYLEKEYEKHNKELKRVRKYLKEKSQKTEFEIFLQNHYDYFLEQALEVTEEWKQYMIPEEYELIRKEGTMCHGDYQYHNIIKTEKDMAVVNFEKCILDDPIRDLYLFMRKLLEKSNWSIELGDSLLEAYNRVSPLPFRSHIALYYRFAYPEKFWKIVNFYYNTGKAWIPGKNLEKLSRLLNQEKEKQDFLAAVFRRV